jgi:site-specific recombinase
MKDITEYEIEMLLLEQRKVKSLEKIANTLDELTIWVEEIDKSEWGERIQYYLSEFHQNIVKQKNE